MADRSQHPGQIMETQTRYDLNADIEKWRSELAAQPNLTPEVRRELETHLRDAIAGFQQRGLNDEESLWLACKRVGQPQQLGEEFVKADPGKIWRERVFWMLAFVFVLDTLGSFTQLIAWFIPDIFWAGWFMINRWYLIPFIVIVTFLGLGKMPSHFLKLAQLIDGRLRLSWVAVFLILSSSVFQYSSALLLRAKEIKMDLPIDARPVWQPIFENSVYPIIIAALVVWLMPSQNRKTPKRA